MESTLYNVLVVDDKNLVADICRTTLEEQGCRVFCADNQQAVGLAEANKIHLVIVHCSLKEPAVMDIFLSIKKTNPLLVGILVTGNGNVDLVVDAMNKGFNRVCNFPINKKQLLAAVGETLKIANIVDQAARMKILLPLYTLGQKFVAAESEKEICEELADAVLQEMHVPSVSVMLLNKETGSLEVVAFRGLDAVYLNDLRIKPGEYIAGKVFETEQPVILNREKQHLSPYYELMKRDEISAAISFPLLGKEGVIGVINVSETKDGVRFSEAEREMLSIIIDQALMALENLRASREREENSRIRALLEQYVSTEVSDLLVTSDRDPLDVGTVEELTILFADIRNFTLLVQNLEPSLLRLFLNSFFEMFGSIVFDHQGMLDKFMGDAALVIFGAPVKVDNPNTTAVIAANQIMVEFEKLRQLWEKKNTVFKGIGLGIGISRGPMFLGNVGSSKRLDYTVIGTDVNIAQRLASQTTSKKILVTARVRNTLDSSFTVVAEKNMLLKGMEEEIEVFTLPVQEGIGQSR